MFSTPVALGWNAAWWPADGLPLHISIPLVSMHGYEGVSFGWMGGVGGCKGVLACCLGVEYCLVAG